VLVTVGTDHHPFDRLLRWTEAWLENGGADRVRCIAQSGSATPPRHADARPFVPYQVLQSLLEQADAVVTHGGPGTIMECRSRGVLPIVVPRRASFGEVVDDHQVDFVRRLGDDVVVVEDADALAAALDRVGEQPPPFRVSPRDGTTSAETAHRVGAIVDALVRRRRSVG
jgi:UDP-N-acetylglucosamine transferase subunit ALG13